jgi:hypothetical protein
MAIADFAAWRSLISGIAIAEISDRAPQSRRQTALGAVS